MTTTVKKGYIPRVKEHKLVGSWIDENGSYGINISKRIEKLQYMISSIKRRASPKKIGVYTVEARLRLAEVVIIPSILHNAEGFPMYKEDEIKQLESVQLKVLTGILEMPQSTPYCALLMEVGWWTMRARLAYKKMMLYHNIVRSDKKRTIQKILSVQEKEARKTPWLNSVRVEIEKYDITLDPKESLKSTWKREIKRRITEKVEKEIREKCRNSTKSRIVKEDKYEKKEYLLGKVSLTEVKKIMTVRMNMSKIPGNYKRKAGAVCPLCHKEEGQTEHYFECRMVHRLKKVWGVNQNDLTSLEVEKMKDVANFMGKVEVMIEPKQSRTWQCGLGTKRTAKG